MPRVTVLIRSDTAPSLHQRKAETDAARDVLRTADELGVSLEPMHAGVDDPALAGYFSVEVADPASAQRVIERLGACEAVEAAYVKPPEAAP